VTFKCVPTFPTGQVCTSNEECSWGDECLNFYGPVKRCTQLLSIPDGTQLN